MQTERVTFLTSRGQKAALDDYARRSGRSVGHILREASARYIAQNENPDELEKEAELDALTRELEEALPKMEASFDAIDRSIAESRAAVREALDHFEGKRN